MSSDGTARETEQPKRLGRDNIVPVLAIVVASILVLWGSYQFVPAPVLAEATDPKAVSAQLGAYLIRWGVVLTVASFIAMFIASVLTSYEWGEKDTDPSAKGAATPLTPWDKLLETLPTLTSKPVGIGISLVLIGALLLVGGSLGSKTPDPAPSPSPTKSP